ncbi:MAG: Nif11-like leader peptide family RiPP precursor [Desulfobaccales bacterium]
MCLRVQTSTSRQAAGPRSFGVDSPLTFEGLKVPFITAFDPKEVIMSVESARAFVERMRRDEEFKKQILAAESAAKRKEIIRRAGFDFNNMHLDALVSELTPEERDALMLM